MRGVAAAFGDVMFYALRSRRRLVLSNLHHAFPERPDEWRHRIGRESCHRMIETGLLSLATPFLPEDRIRRMASVGASALQLARAVNDQPRPVLIATAHLALWESQTWWSLLSTPKLPEFGVIFRPLDNPATDAFVKASRERFGMRLLSRKEGFAEAMKILRRNGFVGILFDQNAGMQGALTLLLDRVCSTTELPGVLASKFGAEVHGLYPRRTGFWRVQFETALIHHDGSTEGITLALNRWLESLLRADENFCASWLWAHGRWRNQDMPDRRLRLEMKRDLLARDVAERQLPTLPRRTRIWIRLPNWLGDVVMALPLLRAIRAGRPDAEITLVGKAAFFPWLETCGVADRLHPLPRRGLAYWRHFWRLRNAYPDVWLLFTNSVRGDLEAWLSGTRQRFGIIRRGKRRPLLSHRYAPPADFNEAEHHQLELWENFLRRFGLTTPADRTPLRPGSSRAPGPRPRIGLIPGSENNPEKRWPVEHWRALIQSIEAAEFVIFGTANDRPIADAVAAGATARAVVNLAGKTDLRSFCDQLVSCDLLVTNDTGGMHLANALGVSLVALFGPTNPVRTGPVFSGTAVILQPPGCPRTGGASLRDLQPGLVVETVTRQLSQRRDASETRPIPAG